MLSPEATLISMIPVASERLFQVHGPTATMIPVCVCADARKHMKPVIYALTVLKEHIGGFHNGVDDCTHIVEKEDSYGNPYLYPKCPPPK